MSSPNQPSSRTLSSSSNRPAPDSHQECESRRRMDGDDFLGLGPDCRQLAYGPGDLVGGPGSMEAAVGFVAHGTVRVSSPPDRHGDVAYQDVHAGGLIGHLEALAGEVPRLSAVAQSNVRLYVTSAEAFETTLENNPALALVILRSMADDTMAQKPRTPPRPDESSHRLYAELLRMAEAGACDSGTLLISRLPRHRELADWTGLDESAVAAALANLVKSGCAERRYPGLVILDGDRLRHLALGG